MFCVQCGAKLADDAKFCMQCGAKVMTIAQPGPSVEPVPAVEPAPAVEAVPVEPAPEVEAVPVEPAPAVEAVPVEPAPAVENVVVEAAAPIEPVSVAEPGPAVVPEPAAEPVSVMDSTPAEEPAPAFESAPAAEPVQAGNMTSNASGAPAGTEPAKKKPKVWLIVLIVVLVLILICGCGGCGIGFAVLRSNTKKLSNAITSEVESNIDGIFSEFEPDSTDSDYPDSIDDYNYGTEAVDVSMGDISNAFYEGSIKIESVSGADELIRYLEEASGISMGDSEKEEFRNPDISSSPNMQLRIFSANDADPNGKKYEEGEFALLIPYACGIMFPEYHTFSGYDMLTNEEIDSGSYADLTTIRPVNGKFSLKRQVPDEGKIYASNLLKNYAKDIDGGDFGSELTGTFREGRLNGDYGIDGTYTIMLWYGDMEEPYVVKYSYSVDYICSMEEYYNMVNGNGFDNDDYDFEDSDFEDFDFDN